MRTNDCNKAKPCGCEDQPYASLPPCNPVDCPNPYPCSDVINAQCVIYTGDDIECDNDVVVSQDTTMAQALADVVDYFCGNTGGSNTVVQAGINITVVSNTAGNTTTYTVSSPCPMSVRLAVSDEPRSIEATVTGGVGPYTYVWEMADFLNGGTATSMWVLNPGLTNNVVIPTFNPAFLENLDANSNTSLARIGLAKVTVTDNNGCIAKDTLLLIEFAPIEP